MKAIQDPIVKKMDADDDGIYDKFIQISVNLFAKLIFSGSRAHIAHLHIFPGARKIPVASSISLAIVIIIMIICFLFVVRILSIYLEHSRHTCAAFVFIIISISKLNSLHNNIIYI